VFQCSACVLYVINALHVFIDVDDDDDDDDAVMEIS